MSADADRSPGRSRPAGASAGDGGRFAILQGKELRQRLIARDEQALVELIEVATPWLLGVTHAMLSDESDAEDVVQEAYVRAYKGLKKFRGDAEFTSWMYRITANCAKPERTTNFWVSADFIGGFINCNMRKINSKVQHLTSEIKI